MGEQGLVTTGRDSTTCAPQVTWSLEEVFSITEGYTRQLGCHKTCQQRTPCASKGCFVALLRMYVSSEEQTWLWTNISLSPDKL
ncbi:hypothetical protein DPMN_092077 [Dreissena polymorpha]|uniref:Uncharacterized protein n=1 Tax=Dreissena polymorpha TaxID=45954 RepID=A0A9D4L2Q5_DREPO|nr:hypothetical protein DPMN_091985 [Dreissena polymorpha]KAH3849674.1 hypothetical protein DPMN_092077 [Dreissena polymorpha]